ncbi:hypothetical protein [Empedobacter sp.]|uniref:hypothetical protein n=1 Tax=Empedobacter sp. TaxID=1927715 RepID=UPI0028A26BF1|nr:hypothetical protein [Empedobacter sp.]
MVYYINDQNQVILSYAFSYQLVKDKNNDIVHVIINAMNGAILEKHNNTLSCGFDHGAFHN